MTDIAKNYQALQRRIQSSLALTGQEESGFTIVAVSKKKSLADIETAYNPVSYTHLTLPTILLV